jgi:hypothetical protein
MMARSTRAKDDGGRRDGAERGVADDASGLGGGSSGARATLAGGQAGAATVGGTARRGATRRGRGPVLRGRWGGGGRHDGAVGRRRTERRRTRDEREREETENREEGTTRFQILNFDTMLLWATQTVPKRG